MALTALEFELLLFMIAGVILRSFLLLDEFIIVSFPFRDVSLLDILVAFTILIIISNFIHHVFHVGGGGSASSGVLDSDAPEEKSAFDVFFELDDDDSFPIPEYVYDMEDLD